MSAKTATIAVTSFTAGFAAATTIFALAGIVMVKLVGENQKETAEQQWKDYDPTTPNTK